MSITQSIPWWGKIMAKLILARLPIPHDLWNKISIFQHGEMEHPSYAYGVFRKHFNRVQLEPGFISLELGPGDSLFSSMISHAFGGSKSWLVDVAAFAATDLQPYRAMTDFLTQQGKPCHKLPQGESLADLLRHYDATYLTAGLASLRQIPSQSVDFIWSHAVLEHVKRSEFLAIMQEFRRILKPGGVCSHEVDLRDHLGGALNHLRFTETLWESTLMSNSGFYTNRIHYPDMVKLFQQAGFLVETTEISRWATLPTPKSKLSQEFSHRSDEDLSVDKFAVVLKPI